MAQQKIEKKVSNTWITAIFEGNGIVNFYDNQKGRACYNTHSKEWVKVRGEFGPRFKAQLIATFKV